ncbi:MAG TPA: response regulator transcription factor, partial [Xenococcaceae cyanobacterium]
MTRILLVDDQNLILELLQMRLESEPDLEIVGLANDGKMAIQQVEKLQPDIVLLDLAMPVMNGLAATEIIRDRFPQTKIVILTGNEDPAYLAKALKAGA